MATVASLKDLDTTLTGRMEDIKATLPVFQTLKAAYAKVYGEHDLRYQTAIGPAVDQLMAADSTAGPDLHREILALLPMEEERAETRYAELREKLLPDLAAEIAMLLRRSQVGRERHHAANLTIAERERTLQTDIAAGEAELANLNATVKQKARWLGAFWRFFAVNKLVRQRNKTFKAVTALQQQLEQTRKDWQAARQQESETQERYRQDVQAKLLEQARLQAEFDYLDDTERRAFLAHQRTARAVIDGLREPPACPLPDLATTLTSLAELNVVRDRYQEGLTKAAHLEGLFNGLTQGLDGFRGGVRKMIQQQTEYSSYLKPLQITIPQESLDFFKTLAAARKAFGAAGGFAEDPVVFAQQAQGFVAALDDDTIRVAFESLGAALTEATEKQWK
ncbi:MAG: hypothetical protein BWY63_03286 [Chloroflexi bacterium ADurb.Bin360]|nr:MAG: hypothetical protein BWY63_03286 [Chloroflexi bacterium ADurb.Bin360]